MTSQTDRTNGLIGDTGMKAPVRLATTAAITLSGEQTIDGVAAVTDDAVLVKDQADTTTNGIYLVDTGAWTRRPDCDGPYDLRQGSLVLVVAGTASAGKTFQCTTADPIVVGSSALSFTQYVVGAAPSTPVSLANGGFGAANATLLAALALLGVVQCTAEAGTANVQTATVDAAVTAFRADQLFIFTPTIANTSAATLTLTASGGPALGAPAVKIYGAALTGGELAIGVPVLLQYDGTALNIVGPAQVPILKIFVNAKGDLISASANDTPAILSVGTAAQILQVDSTQASGLVWRSKMVSLGSTATTSGTSIDFTGIPTWVNRVTITFVGVSSSGSSNYLVQLGAGSIVATGYIGSSSSSGTSTIATATYTTGFGLFLASAASVGSGVMTLTRHSGNTWCATWIYALSSSTTVVAGAGSIALSGDLDRVRLTTVGGSDTFDAGSINVQYE